MEIAGCPVGLCKRRHSTCRWKSTFADRGDGDVVQLLLCRFAPLRHANIAGSVLLRGTVLVERSSASKRSVAFNGGCCCRSGVSKVRPAGQMRSASTFHKTHTRLWFQVVLYTVRQNRNSTSVSEGRWLLAICETFPLSRWLKASLFKEIVAKECHFKPKAKSPNYSNLKKNLG